MRFLAPHTQNNLGITIEFMREIGHFKRNINISMEFSKMFVASVKFYWGYLGIHIVH